MNLGAMLPGGTKFPSLPPCMWQQEADTQLLSSEDTFRTLLMLYTLLDKQSISYSRTLTKGELDLSSCYSDSQIHFSDRTAKFVCLFFLGTFCDFVALGMVARPHLSLLGLMTEMMSCHSILMSMDAMQQVPRPLSWPLLKDTWKLSGKSSNL